MTTATRHLKTSILGAGRIGAVHARTIFQHRDAQLSYVYDVIEASARTVVDRYGGTATACLETAMAPETVDAVIICSPTPTHADLIEQAVNRGLAVFCEKPIDLDIDRTQRCEAVIGESAHLVQLGFNRRFDPTHSALKKALANKDVGTLQQLVITSRDPTPPSAEYLSQSGGIFRAQFPNPKLIMAGSHPKSAAIL